MDSYRKLFLASILLRFLTYCASMSDEEYQECLQRPTFCPLRCDLVKNNLVTPDGDMKTEGLIELFPGITENDINMFRRNCFGIKVMNCPDARDFMKCLNNTYDSIHSTTTVPAVPPSSIPYSPDCTTTKLTPKLKQLAESFLDVSFFRDFIMTKLNCNSGFTPETDVTCKVYAVDVKRILDKYDLDRFPKADLITLINWVKDKLEKQFLKRDPEYVEDPFISTVLPPLHPTSGTETSQSWSSESTSSTTIESSSIKADETTTSASSVSTLTPTETSFTTTTATTSTMTATTLSTSTVPMTATTLSTSTVPMTATTLSTSTVPMTATTLSTSTVPTETTLDKSDFDAGMLELFKVYRRGNETLKDIDRRLAETYGYKEGFLGPE